MCIRALCALALLAAPVGAVEEEAAALLRQTLDPPAVAYEGQVSVTTRGGGRDERRWLTVRFAPPRSFRRETLDRFGSPALVAASDGETEWVYDRRSGRAWRGEPADRDPALSDPDEELALLSDNYAVRLAGANTVAGRPCRELEVVPRRGGAPAQRLCVDEEEGLVLQRVTFDADGAEASRMRFERVSFRPGLRPEDFRLRLPAGTRVDQRRPAPGPLELEEAARATDMRPRPPAWLPPGYVFESVRLLPYRGATILHFRWSDGVDALSLFQAPARARLRPPAGTSPRPQTAGGARGSLILLPDGKALEWGAGDCFVLVGRLSLESLRRVAESVPRETP